jgi:hypothetical protein
MLKKVKTEDRRPKTEDRRRNFSQIFADKTKASSLKPQASRRIPHTALLTLMPFSQHFFNIFKSNILLFQENEKMV